MGTNSTIRSGKEPPTGNKFGRIYKAINGNVIEILAEDRSRPCQTAEEFGNR